MFFWWLQLYGGKSFLLNNELKKGLVLFLFIFFNFLVESYFLIDEIIEVVLEYNNCYGDQVVECFFQYLWWVDVLVLEFLVLEFLVQLLDLLLIIVFFCCNIVVLFQWYFFFRIYNVCEFCVNQIVGGVKLSLVSMLQCSFFEMVVVLDFFYFKEQIFYYVVLDSIECSNFLIFYSFFSYYIVCCRIISRGVVGFIDFE